MNFKILLTFLMTISFCSCNGQNTNANNITTATPMPINRFDKALFQLINSDDTTLNQQLLNQYPLMTEILGKGILNMQSPEIPGFFNKLENFYSEPTLKNLYADAIKNMIRSQRQSYRSATHSPGYMKNSRPCKFRLCTCTFPDSTRTYWSATVCYHSPSTNIWEKIIRCIRTFL